jgi:Zn-dependent metalloprotease
MRTGLANYIEETAQSASYLRRDESDFVSNKDKSLEFLNKIAPVLKIKDPQKELFIISEQTDQYSQSHIKIRQQFNGIPVAGSESIIHIKSNGKINFHGYAYPTPIANKTAKIDKEQAVQIVSADLEKTSIHKELNTKQKSELEYEGPSSRLIYHYIEGIANELVLAYEVTIRSNPIDEWVYKVNASNGRIIDKYNHTCSVTVPATATDLNGIQRDFNTTKIVDNYYLIDASRPMYNPQSVLPSSPQGVIWTKDAKNTDLTVVDQIVTKDNNWNVNPTAVSAHFNAGATYEYYKNVHKRNSIDNKGGNIISVINVTDEGKSMENAYWNGKFIAYGNGGTTFKPLAAALDVAAHELTHGVIQHSANLNYVGQSGAINESIADIFGVLVDRDDWKIGEEVMRPGTYPSGALRDMSDPHNGGTKGDYYWQPRTMSEYFITKSDNGGVHINSGIPNYAFYLIATAISKEKAEQIYYRALNDYLFASAQFVDLRIAVVEAAKVIYNDGSPEVIAIRNAFDAVGIAEGPGTAIGNQLPPNPGETSFIFHGLQGDPNSLYLLKDTTGIFPISQTPMKNRISVTDNGAFGYFVNAAGRIVRKDLNTNVETIYDNLAIWDNVAISKDGNKIAAISVDKDSSIYVKSINTVNWKKFLLYNPTYTPGVTTKGPQYADALEWDYSGENVMYDCFNEYPGRTDTIEYWDIGFIKVWDNALKNYGDGTIKKLIPTLPEGISIGNPTFAKNSPNVIAYDYIDENERAAYIIGSNIEKGDYDTIFANNTLGFPNYSTDDEVLLFTVVYPKDTSVAYVELQGNKISSLSGFAPIVEKVDRPICFANGSRVTTDKIEAKEEPINIYPTNVAEHINIQTPNYIVGYRIEIVNMLGEVIKVEQIKGSGVNQVFVGNLSEGTYFIKLFERDVLTARKFIKLK